MTDIDLRCQTQNIRVTRNDSWSIELRLKNADLTPIDLTGATVLAQIRNSADSLTSVEMVTEITDAENGVFTLGQDAATTQGVYDVQITVDGTTRTYLGGKITLGKDVSR